MASAFELAMTASANIFDAIGVELIIFTVTVVVAFAIKSVNARVQKRVSKLPKKADYDVSSTDDCAKPTKLNREAQETPSRPRSGSFARPDENVTETVERIMGLVAHHPTPQSAHQALALYADLRVMLGLSRKDEIHPRGCGKLAEAMRRSKQPATNFYFTLMQCAIRSKQCHLVDRIVLDMKALCVPRSAHFYESAMKQLAGQKQHHLALSVYDHLNADGMHPSSVTWSCLVGFAAEVGDHERAVRFFDMLSARTTPSIRAYMTILRVHAKQQDWTAAAATLGDMQKRRVPVDCLALNVVLATGIAADKLDDVEAMLTEADAANPPISDVVSYNTLMKGYAQRGDIQSAFRIKERMERRGLKPNAITFNTLMDATVRGNNSSQAWEVLALMKKHGYHPDKFTCSILLKSLSKNSAPEEILSYSALLQEVGAQFDPALKGAYYHTLFQVASEFFDNALLMQIVTDMRQQRVRLNDMETKTLQDRVPSIHVQE